MLSKQFHLFSLNCHDISIFFPGLKTQKLYHLQKVIMIILHNLKMFH